MRLHRLRVKSFRGIDEREIVFAETGITVIEGANEAGKSSMIEALDLLLGVRSDSGAKSVKAVQPSGCDVGSEVEAELSCGEWTFTYFKRFNKKHATTLTITAPVPEQLTGRAAHERVEQILDASLDRTLFDALRLLQSGDPALSGLDGSTALSRALDLAARQPGDGQAGGDASAEALVEKVDAAYREYYTEGRGQPTGRLKEAIGRAERAQRVFDDAAARRRQVEDDAEQLPRVAARIAQLNEERTRVAVAVSAANGAVDQAEALLARTRTAREAADGRELARAMADREVAQRRKERDAVEAMAVQVREREELIAASGAEAGDAAREAAELAALVDVAEQEARSVHDRIALAELEATLAEVSRLHAELADIGRVLAGPPVTATDAAAARTLGRQLAEVRARLGAAAASVVITPLGERGVLLGGEPLTAEREVCAVADTVVEVPGAVRVLVRGGADAQAISAELDVLTATAQELSARCGVPGLAEVADRAAAQSRARARKAELDRALARELAGRAPDQLTEMTSELRRRIGERGDAEPGRTGDESADEVDLPGLRVDAARRDGELATLRKRHAQMRATAERARVRGESLGEGVSQQRAELVQRTADLSAAVAAKPDAELAADLAAAEAAAQAARDERLACEKEFGAVDHEALRGTQSRAEAQRERVGRELEQCAQRQTQLATRIDMYRDDARMAEYEDAESELAAAQDHLARVSERAAGARLLRETLQRTRQESRSGYAGPFTRRLEELAAPVFGEQVRFEVGEDFGIVSRTLDGTVVDADALSGGAREQLGLLARLACATLVDSRDGVPVIIDDALGYSDPARLASMGQVFSSVGDQAQVVVLTCTPDRYRGIADATVVRL